MHIGRKLTRGGGVAVTTRMTVIGETIVDILPSADGTAIESLGGSPANVAVGLARLGHPTRLFTQFGTDDRGARIAQRLREESVELVPGSQSTKTTASAQVDLSAHNGPTYAIDLHWNPDSSLLDLHTDEHVHTGSLATYLAPGDATVASLITTARPSCTISFDPNIRAAAIADREYARQRILKLLGQSDVVKASADDLAWLYPDQSPYRVIADWASLGPTICVLTLAGQGAVGYGNGQWFTRPVRPSPVMDTVGAGDAFTAGLLSGLMDAGLLGGHRALRQLRSADLSQLTTAVDRGLAAAAYSVSRIGADPPRRSDLGLSER